MNVGYDRPARAMVRRSNIKISGEERFERLFPQGSLTLYVNTTERFSITTQGSSAWRFDNIAFDKKNLDVFLNLSSGSPCIDATQETVDSSGAFRDFDDSAGPLGPIGSEEKFRDIGAHEYPDLEEGVYWWNRF